MKHIKLEEMTIEQLVERFVDMALDQDEALRLIHNAKYNSLYGQMQVIREELKSRPGDGRRALIPLLQHPNAHVRLKSAIATLALTPEASRRTLQIIAERNEWPQAPDARGMLMSLDAGRYIPS